MEDEKKEDLSIAAKPIEEVHIKTEEKVPLELETEGEKEEPSQEDIYVLKKELSELKDKYLRLYADFENYKRLVAKEKEELIKYSNEALMREMLPVIDHLELALQHSSNSESSKAIAEGVQMTLNELKSTLGKFGLADIPALGAPFDPSVHHAIAQVESEETEENIVVREFRKGYILNGRVLRATLVGVSKNPLQEFKQEKEE